MNNICNERGYPLQGNEAYCPGCGCPVPDGEVTVLDVPTPIPEVYTAPEVNVSANNGGPEAPEEYIFEDNPKSGKGNGLKWFLIALCSVLILALFFLGFGYLDLLKENHILNRQQQETELQQLQETINSMQAVDEEVSSQKAAEAKPDTKSVQSSPDYLSSDFYEGKTYSGFGNFAGCGCDATISFLSDGKCKITSDFYRAYPPSEMPTVSGKYRVSGGKLKVTFPPDSSPFPWEFTIRRNGKELAFDFSDPSSGGSVGNNFMILTLRN